MIPNPFHRSAGSAPEIRLSTNDFRILLDQLAMPALLVNLSKQVILASNFAFTNLTGFGMDEISSSSIEKLIPDTDQEKITDGALRILNVSCKNRNPIQAEATIKFFSQNEKLVLLTFAGKSAESIGQEPVTLNLINSWITNLGHLFEATLEELIREILESVKQTFQARYAVFYLQCGAENEPNKIGDGAQLFPENIPAIETKRLNQTDFWEPGKRVLSEIHRVGRMNNLPAVISLPIAIDASKQGLLIIVLDDLKQRERDESLLRPISEWISALLSNHQIYMEVSNKNRVFSDEINQYSQFYENARDCALILDGQNVILDCNKNACDFLKYSQVELFNQKAEIIFENSEIKEILKQGDFVAKSSGQAPVIIFDREGNPKPVAYKVIPLEMKEPSRKLLVITDLTVQTESEKKMHEYENKAALGDVIADFAHEVRNPMNSFVSGLQVMKKKTAADDSTRSTIEQMQDDCMRINDLMESVLSYSRQKIENFKDVDLEVLLKRILNQNSSKFKQSGVEALFQSKAARSVTSGDQRSLEQAFINLISNAFDAIKQDGGVISVQIEEKGNAGEFLEVSISDTGPGIPPEIREKLFEPFVSGKPKGTGLGLAITKRMIEAHQGKIELETYPGGTIFRVLLPLKANQGEPA